MSRYDDYESQFKEKTPKLALTSHVLLEMIITINAPLILKMRDIIFFAGKLHNGPFQGIFRGGQDFFDP